jgi:hypothetical protein
VLTAAPTRTSIPAKHELSEGLKHCRSAVSTAFQGARRCLHLKDPVG